jgi:long-chain acyl-CoA synthetase
MTGGVEPVAVVLFVGGDEELHAAVIGANGGLAAYQQIRRVLRWPELQFPYTSTGKLLRRKVAEWACAAVLGQRTPGLEDGDMLVNLIALVTGERVAGEGDGLRLSEDLHLDSLGRVQLQSEVEQRLGVELEDDAIATVATLGELRTLVKIESGAGGLPQSAVEMAGGAAEQWKELRAAPAETSEHVYPRWPWRWPVRIMRVAFLEGVMRPLIWLLAAPRVVWRTKELPQGPLLVIANHVTAFDGALVLYALPARLRRRIAIAMLGDMLLDLRRGQGQRSALYNFVAPASYWLATALFNVFPLPRQRGFRRSFEHAGEAMDRGYSVMIFPEGARSEDGKLHPFRQGIGLLAQESQIPVVPVAMVGLSEMRRSGWFRSGRLELRVGEAIPVDERTDPAELTVRLEERVRQLQS